MKCVFLILPLMLLNLIIYGQADKISDTIVNKICLTLNETKNLSDSELLVNVYKNQIIPFLSKFPQNEQDAISDALYFRLNRNCQVFADIMNKQTLLKGDFKLVGEKPSLRLNSEDCKHFLDSKNFNYVDSKGDTMWLTINNGLWIDRFNDGTFSKLKFNWISDCEFNIEFIESNNVTRKKMSKSGDKYNYQILEKHKKYYLMSFEIPGSKKFMTFKMYYKK